MFVKRVGGGFVFIPFVRVTRRGDDDADVGRPGGRVCSLAHKVVSLPTIRRSNGWYRRSRVSCCTYLCPWMKFEVLFGLPSLHSTYPYYVVSREREDFGLGHYS